MLEGRGVLFLGQCSIHVSYFGQFFIYVLVAQVLCVCWGSGGCPPSLLVS